MYSSYIVKPERFLTTEFNKTKIKIGLQMINFSVYICVTELYCVFEFLYCVIEFLTNVIDMCTIIYKRRTLLIERREYIRIKNLIHPHHISHRTSLTLTE